MLINDSRTIWKILNGVICVYKPADLTTNQIRKTLVSKLCKELCELQDRDPEKYVSIEGVNTSKLSVKVQDSFADNTLVVGPRHIEKDVKCNWVNFLGRNTSGVLLFGINNGTRQAFHIRQSKPIRAYRISGKFGEATDNFYKDGKIAERSTYAHIKRGNIDRLVASLQSSHQKKMFELCGVDMNSETGYKLAIQGPIRPADSKIPVMYGIKCIYFEPPYFTIEVQIINEYEMYLKALIHEIGMKMNSTAHCISLQCIRHSYFMLQDALLKKHWTLQNVLDNMSQCNTIIEKHENLTRQQTAALQRYEQAES